MTPDLSVVVPSVNDLDALECTLSALAAQTGDIHLEVIVPERTGDETRRAVTDRFPDVRLIPVEAGTPIPTMRRRAFEASSADAVAVLEDHVVVPGDWAARMVDAVSAENPVVGGWVRNSATSRAVDRAAYICEYGHMLVTQPSGPAEWITGNNVVYHRSILERFENVISQDLWENYLHEAVRRSGIVLQRRSDIVVDHQMHYRSAWDYAGQRYLYSRAFAGMRLSGARGLATTGYALGALILPPLLLMRIVKNGWGAPAYRAQLIRAFPFLSLFVVAWALGEFVGAIAGPGDALGRVR